MPSQLITLAASLSMRQSMPGQSWIKRKTGMTEVQGSVDGTIASCELR